MTTLIILGAGGHGRVVADCAEKLDLYSSIVFIDNCFDERKQNSHWPIIGKLDTWSEHGSEAQFIVAIGNNVLRSKFLTLLLKAKVNLVSIIHPSAVVSDHATIGEGVVIFANAVINVDAKISDGCIINTGAKIDHDCHIGHCCHISPGVNVAGGVTVGRYSWLGIGSAVVEYIELGENTQTGAGAVITQATEANALYLGIPAKKCRSLTIKS